MPRAKDIQKSAELNYTAQNHADKFIATLGIARAEILARRIFEKIMAVKNAQAKKHG